MVSIHYKSQTQPVKIGEKAALHKIAERFCIYWKTIKRFRQRVREITARRRGRSLAQVIGEPKQYMFGWWSYCGSLGLVFPWI